MQIINKKLSLNDFKAYISSFNFAPLNPTKIVLHHTWRPTVDQWQGQKSINGMKAYYEGKGWSNGPHLFIAEDGIWLFTPMSKQGIHAGTGNTKSIGIEIVGDYDLVTWSGKTKENVLGVIKALMAKGIKEIKFHRDYSTKSCPGKAITKEWVLSQLMDEQELKAIEEAQKAYEYTKKIAEDSVKNLERAQAALALLKGKSIQRFTIVAT